MSHKTESKWYNVFAVINTGEIDKHPVCKTLLSKIPPDLVGEDNSVGMYIEGYKAGVEQVTGTEVEFVYEECK